MHIYEYIFQWMLAIAFGLFGWWIIYLNFAAVYLWIFRREHYSRVPLVGGFFAFAGMGFCPVLEIRRLALLPLFIDVSYFLLTLVVGVLMEIYARKKKRNANVPEKAGE